MAEPEMKVGGDLPPVQVSNSMDADNQIMDEPGAAQEATNIPANTDPSPTRLESQTTNKLEPLWKLCDDRPRVQQVQINEEAAEHSRIYFEGVETILKEHSSEFTSCETRLKEIAAIRKRKKDCKVRIGFLGGTGTGKSSLINALLQMRVLPRNEEVASTAVPVEVSYNTDEDAEHRFKATIEGISKAEFTKEVENLFKNKELYNEDPEGEDDEIDIEAYQQMLTTIEKIKWVYPYLQNIDDIDDTSAEELLNEEYVQKMLDSIVEVQASSELQFAHDIKKYIESSKPKEGEDGAISLWPLVKVVRIYVKADILRCGIILVDLPGSHDTSAARVAVADNYRKNLTASVVCAPAVRAGSDRVAQELLGSVERRNMQLDGLYTSDSLFFVVTKIDDLMDYEAYIRDHENLQEANKKDMQTIQDKSRRISELQKELKTRGPKQAKNEHILESMKESQQKLASQVGQILAAISPYGRKRKRVDDLTESEESALNATQRKQIQKFRDLTIKISVNDSLMQKGVKDLYQMREQKESLEADLLQAESRAIKSCIQNRVQIHATAARNEYERVRKIMGQEECEEPLEVFSVSADMFTRLSRGKIHEAQRKGFSTKADTGIPALRDALIAITWGTRQQNTRSFNEDVESCHTRMKLWSADTSSEYKMLDEEKTTVESRMQEEIKKLEKAFSKLHQGTHDEVNQVIEDNIYEILEGRTKGCALAAAKKITLDWCLVPWNTHKAINRNMGLWTSSRQVDYDWNEDLAGIFLDDPLIMSWTNTFHKKRLELLKSYETQVDKTIVDFVESILTSARDIHPAIDEALQSLRENIMGLRTMLKDEAATIFEDINTAAKEAHRTVKPEVIDSWKDIYKQCGEERGKGLFQRNKKAHKDHVKNEGGVAMYQRAGSAIREALDKVLEGLQEKFNSSYNGAITQLQQDLNIVVERHSADSVRTALSQDDSRAKKRLRQALQPYFEKLEKAWGIEPEIGNTEIVAPEQKETAPTLEAEDEDIFDFNEDDWL